MEYALKNKKTILTWLICLTYAGLFFPIRVSNIPLIGLTSFCALSVLPEPKKIISGVKESAFALIMVAMYLLLIIGLLYSDDIRTGLFILEKKICFLLVPLFIFPAMLTHYRNDDDRIFRKLGYVTMLSSVVLLVIGVFRRLILNDDLAFAYVPGNQFEGFTSIHYVYYSMYFGCGSLILIDSLFEEMIKRKHGLILIALLFAYSLGIMILIASKTGIVIYALTSAVFLYHKLENKRVFSFLLVSLLISGCVILYFNETTRNRFAGLSENLSVLLQDELVGELEATGVNMRLLFWKIQLVNAWKDGIILTGTGTGDVQYYIDALYNLPKYQLYGYIGWDSHNQWVYSLVQAGVAAVVLLGLLYYLYFRKAILAGDLRLLTFLMITLGFSLTESILELNKGIVFFTLMFALLNIRRQRLT